MPGASEYLARLACLGFPVLGCIRLDMIDRIVEFSSLEDSICLEGSQAVYFPRLVLPTISNQMAVLMIQFQANLFYVIKREVSIAIGFRFKSQPHATVN